MSADYGPFDLSQREDAYAWLRTQREQDPVFHSPAAEMWVVTRYAAAEQVPKQPDIFSSESAPMGRYNAAVSAKFEGTVPLTPPSSASTGRTTLVCAARRLPFARRPSA